MFSSYAICTQFEFILYFYQTLVTIYIIAPKIGKTNIWQRLKLAKFLFDKMCTKGLKQKHSDADAKILAEFKFSNLAMICQISLSFIDTLYGVQGCA